MRRHLVSFCMDSAPPCRKLGPDLQGEVMSERPYVIDQMISAKSIAARIEELSHEIEVEFANTNKLVVVGLLRGSFVFIADLVREIDLPIEVDFLEASSYGNAMESSREVRIVSPPAAAANRVSSASRSARLATVPDRSPALSVMAISHKGNAAIRSSRRSKLLTAARERPTASAAC